MKRSGALGLVIAITSTLGFSTSGTLAKPLLETGWSPAAVVMLRALLGGLILLPFAIRALKGNWRTAWTGRWRILGMGAAGVAGTQLLYFTALQTVAVSTTLLIEFLSPVLLVLVAWVLSRRVPAHPVLLGSLLAIGGLVLVIGPGALVAPDLRGVVCAFGAMVGCAVYFVVAARDARGLPSIALASFGLLLGAIVLAPFALLGVFPVAISSADVVVWGMAAPWWAPVILVAIIPTAFAYVAGITGTQLLGSRIGSFVGLLEVVFASALAWLFLGQALTAVQLLGGAVLVAGIIAVRAGADRRLVAEIATVDELARRELPTSAA